MYWSWMEFSIAAFGGWSECRRGESVAQECELVEMVWHSCVSRTLRELLQVLPLCFHELLQSKDCRMP